MGYREAWQRQHELVQARATGRIQDHLLLVEHDPVLTLGRHSSEEHLLAAPVELAARGMEIIRVERGGDVTYHGPGQLVAYPIVHLAERGVLLRPFVRALERAMADVTASLGVAAGPRSGYPGCWCDAEASRPRKLGALGLKLERGVTFHGIALNLTTDLADFDLIDPCGLPGIEVTSIARELGWAELHPQRSTDLVHSEGLGFAAAFERHLAEAAAGPGRATAPAQAAA